MSVYLDVPFVSQLNYGDGSMNDPTGCWYCSSCMVAYHFEAGPRMGVPEIHGATLSTAQRAVLTTNSVSIPGGHAAIGSNEAQWMLHAQGINHAMGGYDLLMEREGLEGVPGSDTKTFTAAELETELRGHGPLLFTWQKTHNGQSYGHCSVVIGVDEGRSEVIYHDPENAPNSRTSLADFHASLNRWANTLMRRKGVVSSTVRVQPATRPRSSGQAPPRPLQLPTTPKKKKKGCFLTTACTTARGLPDDCFELTTLRRFRDGYLLATPGGAELIAEYYRVAPHIVTAIEARPDSADVLAGVYRVVAGCVRAIREGRNAAAREDYVALVHRLAAQYLPARTVEAKVGRPLS